MEVNSNVCMNKLSKYSKEGKQLEEKVFSKAIDRMFEIHIPMY